MKNIQTRLKRFAHQGIEALTRLAHRFDKQKKAVTQLPGYPRLESAVNSYRLAFGIGGAIVVCLLLTFFSVLLYVTTGTSKLDLSRPGYENARQKIQHNNDREENFEPNGALDGKVMADYQEKYKKQTRTLSQYDNFDPKLLDDTAIGLTSTQIAPSDGGTP